MEQLKNGQEKGVVERVEFTSVNGLINWRTVSPDGRVGAWEQTFLESGDNKGLAGLKNKLKAEFGPDVVIG